MKIITEEARAEIGSRPGGPVSREREQVIAYDNHFERDGTPKVEYDGVSETWKFGIQRYSFHELLREPEILELGVDRAGKIIAEASRLREEWNNSPRGKQIKMLMEVGNISAVTASKLLADERITVAV